MRGIPFTILAAALWLTGCEKPAPVAVDIVSVERSLSPMFGRPPGAPADAVMMDVPVRAGQLRELLDAGGGIDLRIVACAAPEGEGMTIPLYFGSEPIAGLSAAQIDDDPDTQIGLYAAVPARLAARPGQCARLVGQAGALAPDVISNAVPLPRDVPLDALTNRAG